MDPSELLSDISAVRRTMLQYVAGASGDADLLSEVFHENACMFGHIGDTRRDVPVARFIDGVKSAAHDLVDDTYHYEITQIQVSGLAAQATLVETGYRGCDFVNYFTLAKIDNTWKIVTKTFTCTGGEFR